MDKKPPCVYKDFATRDPKDSQRLLWVDNLFEVLGFIGESLVNILHFVAILICAATMIIMFAYLLSIASVTAKEASDAITRLPVAIHFAT